MPALILLVFLALALAFVGGIGLYIRPGDAGEQTCHAAPPVPPDIDEAHEIMQDLINCDVDDCDRKRAAWWVLVDAGEITPVEEVKR
ncbi:hypothetical protein [Nocardia brasiliensis]|uniref:hypothetical protein n=1 Tax=Nocardia brasiliensis TaxID=37326 RepID=UPI0004A6D299|nr:hypothetical protein [Nocardia brasiliensis]